jgi:hypothetical protein
MPTIVYRISHLLCHLLRDVYVGTNLGLYSLLWSLLSGRFLMSRGAVIPALSALGLEPPAVKRSEAALCYGRWKIAALLTNWQQMVVAEGHFQPHAPGGIRPVPVDITAFYRAHLQGCVSKHYTSQAGKALPSLVFGLAGAVGSVSSKRWCLPRLILRQEEGETETTFARRLLAEAGQTLQEDEALIVDAGFKIADLLGLVGVRFVVRAAQNVTARQNQLPKYKGRGCPPQYGEFVRPLAGKYKNKRLPATPPDQVLYRKIEGRRVKILVWHDLVLPDQKPGSPSFRCVVYVNPRYKKPLVLLTNLDIDVEALLALYRDRWPIETVPQAAKSLLGCERAFVFGQQSRYRLPELALLAGNLLSYVAATSPPVATGFWDRVARPTCGRLRRVLSPVHFWNLPLLCEQLRKKASVTEHLPKGILGHRRQKAVPNEKTLPIAAGFTGN